MSLPITLVHQLTIFIFCQTCKTTAILFFFLKEINLFIYLFYFWLRWVFVAVCCWLFLVVASGGYLFFAVRGLLIAVASLEEHGL